MNAPPVPLRLDGSPERLAELTGALEATLDGNGPPVLPVGAGGTAPPEATTVAPEGTAVVIATSGSTGEPKLVVLSGAALRASAEATAERLGGARARWLLALPAEHIAGVQVIVRALLDGGRPAVQDLRGGFRPSDFVAATGALPAGPRRTSLVPTQLVRLLDAGGAALDALRSYDAVIVGGAPLDPRLDERATRTGVRVVRSYGMSETAGGCVYDGAPLEGVIVDLEPDGRILLGGRTLADGYLGRPGETAAAFVDGRFRSGDLGRWREGRLDVLGRTDDMIVTGGANVAPAAVERVLAAQPGVLHACVVGVPDPEWGQAVAAAVVLAANAPKGWADELRAAVRAELGRESVPRHVVAVGEIPLRGVGKPDRAATARLLHAGE